MSNINKIRKDGIDYDISSSEVYSTEEQKIGTWVNGKPIYRKVYTGPKINRFLLKTCSFYRLYVHYLYFFGKLPAKNQYKE